MKYANQTLPVDTSATLTENVAAMLAHAGSLGVTLIMCKAIWKPLKEHDGITYNWTEIEKAFQDRTEKTDKRGWYSIKDVTVPTQTVEQTTEETTVENNETTEEDDNTVVINGQGVAYIPTKTETDLALYAEDESLKRIALMSAKCFGEYSNKAKQCKGCPLAGSCQVSAFAKYAVFAAELDKATEEALKPKEVKVEEPVVEEKVEEQQVETTKEENAIPELKEGWRYQESTVITTVCSECEEAIPAGTACINISGKGNFHLGCAK